jgi:pilus assembly protein CpaC
MSQALKPARRRLAVLMACAALVLSGLTGGGAAAQVMASDEALTRSITVAKDKSAAFRLDYPVSEIVVAQPETLQLVATTDHSFYIRGKQLGVTNILVYDKQHRLAQVIDVHVCQDIHSLQSDLESALPGEHIIAASFAGGVLLSGRASTSAVEMRAKAIAEHYAPKDVSSTVTVQADKQIMVEVRMIEASRNSLRDVGFNVNAQNQTFAVATGNGIGQITNQPPQGTISLMGRIGGASVDVSLAALEQKGVIRTLAKPNLIAMSGEEASFLAGGEFPYPVPQGLNIVTVDFRTYGVKLKVTPTVQDNGEIRLKVAPEVSQLDPAHSITIDGISLPALITTNASTTVELRDGQSFAIAGLFQQGYNNTLDQFPGLGNLPVLGSLFRSSNFQKQETELIIIVTPRMTAPVDDINTLPNPLAKSGEPNAIDLIIAGLTETAVKSAAATQKP